MNLVLTLEDATRQRCCLSCCERGVGWRLMSECLCRKTTATPRLLDDTETERQMEAKRAEIQAYKQSRNEVSERREHDRKLRNSLKALQMKLYEQMQVSYSLFVLLYRWPAAWYHSSVACLSPGEADTRHLLVAVMSMMFEIQLQLPLPTLSTLFITCWYCEKTTMSSKLFQSKFCQMRIFLTRSCCSKTSWYLASTITHSSLSSWKWCKIQL